MKAQSCAQCRSLALFLKEGLCQPCRLRGGEIIPGHRIVAEPEPAPPATVIVCSRGGGCEIVQLPLGEAEDARSPVSQNPPKPVSQAREKKDKYNYPSLP